MTRGGLPGEGGAAPDALLRLASGKAEAGFLAAHHLEAARRLARLFERARIVQRVTMSYDPTRIGGASNKSGQGDVSDSAADARRLLGQLAQRLPRDCWGVLTDTCGFDKGLQQVELERQWPRRSAKLVLRIGLEQLAGIMGLLETAQGRDAATMQGWLTERPAMFPDEAN